MCRAVSSACPGTAHSGRPEPMRNRRSRRPRLERQSSILQGSMARNVREGVVLKMRFCSSPRQRGSMGSTPLLGRRTLSPGRGFLVARGYGWLADRERLVGRVDEGGGETGVPPEIWSRGRSSPANTTANRLHTCLVFLTPALLTGRRVIEGRDQAGCQGTCQDTRRDTRHGADEAAERWPACPNLFFLPGLQKQIKPCIDTCMERAGTRSMRRSSGASVKRVAVCSATSTALMQVQSHLCNRTEARASFWRRVPVSACSLVLVVRVVGEGPGTPGARQGIPRNASSRERCPNGLATAGPTARSSRAPWREWPSLQRAERVFVCPYYYFINLR